MSRINSNVSSHIAQTHLARSNADLQTALTRLSTGLRINTGKDDPAGLIASENLRRDITSVEKAITNSERANQLIATADSALGQVSGLLNDIRGLVTEAANTGVLSEDQIAANQLQIDSSLEAIDRIAQTTTFQGRRLLDGSLSFITNVTAGGSTIQALNIEQANLGVSGQVAVNVDITSAAERASITYTAAAGDGDGDGGTAATEATLAFSAGVVTEAVASGTTFRISATALGEEFAGVEVIIADGGDIGQGNETAEYDAEAGTLTITIDDDASTAADVLAAINDLEEFQAAIVDGDGTDAVVAADAGTIGTTGLDSIALTATGDGLDFNNITIAIENGDDTGAVFDAESNTLTLTIANDGDTLANIVAALDGLDGFSATGTQEGDDLVGETGSIDLTAELSVAGAEEEGGDEEQFANATLSFAASAVTTAVASGTTFRIQATALGAEFAGVEIIIADGGDIGQGNETAVYDENAGTLTITIDDDATTAADVLAAINDLDDFEASIVNGDGTDAVVAADAGTIGTTGIDSIAITAAAAGPDFNNVSIVVASGTETGAAYDAESNTLTITIDEDGDTLANIVAAIDGLDEFSAEGTQEGDNLIGEAGSIDLDATANTGETGGAAAGDGDGDGDGDGGGTSTATLAGSLVLQVSGANGSEVFNFETGTLLTQVAAALNLVSDATGVTATADGDELTFQSTKYGSSAFVQLEVISEGEGGNFEENLSSLRDTGSDIVAAVNGVRANGNGNTLSINTSTLDLNLTVSAGSDTNVAFTITGGGAVFQLGPDVVTNQQARLGIQSINTARLGGASGRLYELGSGGSASLANDTTRAAAIVDEVINQVIALRGRLGAFQKTTLDTNIASLNDTLTNLTEAESSIRDADFAKESAALTRAQILVQSGTSVLAIANQNPQNVLALLR